MLNRIVLHNFKRHRDLTIDFTTGINATRGANEAGKSSILHAVAYALFGAKALPHSIDDCVTWGEDVKTLKVVLDLTAEGRSYSFSRSKGGAEVVLDGEVFCTGQNEVSALAALLLGADATLANKLMFSNQGNLRNALEEGPKALSLLIEELAGFSAFDNILTAAQEKLALGSPALLEERLKGAEQTLAAATESLPVKPDAEAHEKVIATLKAKVTSSETTTPLLEAKVTEAMTQWQEASALFLKRIELEGKVTKASEVLDAALAQVAALKPAAEIVVSDSREALKAQIAEAEDFDARIKAYRVFKALPEGAVYPGSAAQFDEAHEAASSNKAAIENAIHVIVNKMVAAKARRINHDKCDKCGQDVTHLTTVIETNAAVDAEVSALNTEESSRRTELEQACRVWNSLESVRRHANKVQQELAKLHGYTSLDEATYPATATWVGSIPGDTGFDTVGLRRALAEQEAEVKAAASAKAKHELAMEQQGKAHNALTDAQQNLAKFVGPDADTILALTEAKDQATLALHATQGEAILAKQEIEVLERDYEVAMKLWSMSAARIADAQTVIDTCKKDLASLGFNNALVKKLRAIRPIVANKIWSTVLASVSVMFSQMRGEPSVVTKETSGFKVNGQSVESLSGSTLDVLGIALRCSLLRTFVPQCGLLILDEPAQGCDTTRTESMLGFLQSLGMTQTLLVTHEDISSSVADNIIEL